MERTNLACLVENDIREDVNYLKEKIYKKVRKLLESVEKSQDPSRALSNIILLLEPQVDIVHRDLVWSNMVALPGVKIRFIAEFMGRPVDNGVAILEIFGEELSRDPNKQIVFDKKVSLLLYRLIKIEDNKDYSGSLYEKLLETEKEEK